jgi:hypothetical protein
MLTLNQTTAFFEDPGQMGIPHATVVQLQEEGINVIDDLVDFDVDTIKQVAENLRRPTGRVPHPNGVANATIATPPFKLAAMSQFRLNGVIKLLKYYRMVGRVVTAANIQWTPVIKNFLDQFTSIEEMKKGDDPDTPKISSTLKIMPWIESIRDYWDRKFTGRNIPFA